MKVAVLCSGRGSNLSALLEAKARGELPCADFRAVLSDQEGAGALDAARVRGIDALTVRSSDFKGDRPGFEKRILEALAPYSIELAVLAGFQRVLGRAFLDAFPAGVMNIHPALLPSFPGHMVWSKETDYGVKLAGATAHFVDEGVDSGPIICQGAVPVLETDGPDELSARILKVEHRIFPAAVGWVTSGRVSMKGRTSLLKGFEPKPGQAEAFLAWPALDA
ncbi:MAG: phosphoribosylglycinamide formyltransferase [Deltaproteobacteria bacterium]|jgi:phosphoribosylglycinamide formyltransferase-1|nr:phosphoribosylglycinamide formyltransferase [Deltaproteobacteria bacterium]